MLDAVDWACVRANPKVFVGYSDITTLHLALERRAGLRAFHGPMVTTLGQGLSPSALATFVACLTSDKPIVYRVEAPARARCLVPGRAEGPIAGGCLSLLCAALGTPDQPDFTGRLVLLEDTDEPLYRADRLLAQLTASGLLDAAAGFIVGTLSNLGRDHEEPAFDLDDLWSRYLAPLGKPTILDVPFGHVDDPWTLPLGCMAEMDAEECVLATTEASVE
jgi:muramoyltetrapeptide carboxypeptidase